MFANLWLWLLQRALNWAVTAIQKIPAEKWAEIGEKLKAFILKLIGGLPAGHPAIRALFDANAEIPYSKAFPDTTSQRQ